MSDTAPEKPEKGPDFSLLLRAYKQADNGVRAAIRRCASVEQLQDEPAFYRLVGPLGYASAQRQCWARVVFCLCLPAVEDVANGPTLGAALAEGGRITDRRLFQVLRSEAPQDMTQLRRLILFVEPTLDWQQAAKALWFWSARSKRELLEDFILSQPANSNTSAAVSAGHQ